MKEKFEKKNNTAITDSWTEFLLHNSVVSPLNELLIPDFARWICWNGYRPKNGIHPAFDFALYENSDGKPFWIPSIPVRAIAEGIVDRINTKRGGYWGKVSVNHSRSNSWLGSLYGHVVPEVTLGQHVQQGETIGTLYWDGNRLTHLHFELMEPVEFSTQPRETFDWDRYLSDERASIAVNPSTVFPFLDSLNYAHPQADENFTSILRR